jgi:hypothetical protein
MHASMHACGKDDTDACSQNIVLIIGRLLVRESYWQENAGLVMHGRRMLRALMMIQERYIA